MTRGMRDRCPFSFSEFWFQMLLSREINSHWVRFGLLYNNIHIYCHSHHLISISSLHFPSSSPAHTCTYSTITRTCQRLSSSLSVLSPCPHWSSFYLSSSLFCLNGRLLFVSSAYCLCVVRCLLVLFMFLLIQFVSIRDGLNKICNK